jgi:hypothetical protein
MRAPQSADGLLERLRDDPPFPGRRAFSQGGRRAVALRGICPPSASHYEFLSECVVPGALQGSPLALWVRGNKAKSGMFWQDLQILHGLAKVTRVIFAIAKVTCKSYLH